MTSRPRPNRHNHPQTIIKHTSATAPKCRVGCTVQGGGQQWPDFCEGRTEELGILGLGFPLRLKSISVNMLWKKKSEKIYPSEFPGRFS